MSDEVQKRTSKTGGKVEMRRCLLFKQEEGPCCLQMRAEGMSCID